MPSVDVSLSEIKKRRVPDEAFHAETLQHVTSFTYCTITYTDGSKTSGSLGCSFVSGDTKRSSTLPRNASLDSLSCILALGGYNSLPALNAPGKKDNTVVNP